MYYQIVVVFATVQIISWLRMLRSLKRVKKVDLRHNSLMDDSIVTVLAAFLISLDDAEFIELTTAAQGEGDGRGQSNKSNASLKWGDGSGGWGMAGTGTGVAIPSDCGDFGTPQKNSSAIASPSQLRTPNRVEFQESEQQQEQEATSPQQSAVIKTAYSPALPRTRNVPFIPGAGAGASTGGGTVVRMNAAGDDRSGTTAAGRRGRDNALEIDLSNNLVRNALYACNVSIMKLARFDVMACLLNILFADISQGH